MPPIEEVILDSNGGKPTVEILFGQAHVGNYRCFLWNRQGKDPEELAHGDNVDDVVDAFEIDAEPADLDRRIISVESIVQAAEAKPGQIYSVTITIRQQGKVCSGGAIHDAGPFEDVKALVAFRRFKTA